MKFAIIALTFVVFSLAVSCRFRGAFQKTCKDVSLDGSVLIAKCENWTNNGKTREEKTSKLDLDKCIGNIDGKLTWGHTDYKKTSKSCKLINQLTLQCESQSKKGAFVTTTYDLGLTVTNTNGTLTCDKKMRRRRY